MRTLWLGLAIACTAPPDATKGPTDTGTVASCAWDADEAPVALAFDTPTEGFLCPLGDVDTFRVTLPPEARLLEVSAAIDSIVSPIEVTWTVYEPDGTTVIAGPAPGEAAVAGVPLTLVHAVDTSPVLVQVRDLSNDAQDIRHPYTITARSHEDVDLAEPNDVAELAVTLADTATGTIASRGDHDWYRFEAPANSAATLHLSSAVADYEPRISVRAPDGSVVRDAANPAGSVQATDLLVRVALEQAGTWRVLVQDDDDRGYDLDTPYQLSLALGDDPDGNEPNDHPGSSTPLLSATCGGSWSALQTDGGFLATSGDIDWYALDLAGCARGIVEADVRFGAGGLPPGFEAELRLLRAHSNTTCTLDQDCTSLAQRCTTDDDCSTVGYSCGLDGYCEGAGVCLPSQRCGANLLVEEAEPGAEGRVGLSAPLFDPGPVWLGVADHRGDAYTADVPYTIDARVRTDPDVHEPNNHYTAGPPTGSQSSLHDDLAVEIPVHHCIDPPPADTSATADTGAPPEPKVCCTDVAWTEGVLAYDYDQDWFRYRHPCPDEDCMVRLHVQVDGGPVDTLVQVWRRSALWFDGITGVTDLGAQGPVDVAYGGLEPTDQCFYAYNGHDGSPYWYHVSLRDTIYAGSGSPTGGTWDHSDTQRYRLCVEKLAEACLAPCEEDPNGCDTP